MINYSLKRGVIGVFFLLLAAPVLAQKPPLTFVDSPTPSNKELLAWKEVFTYEVRYSFFKIGEVQVEIVSDTLYNNKPSWHLRSVITSNSSIPFMHKEENHYHSIFSLIDNTFQVQEYWSDNVDEGIDHEAQYIYDREAGKVYANIKDEPSDTLALEEPALTGHAIFYLGRLTAGVDSVLKFPLYLNKDKKYLTLTSSSETDIREYKAFEGKVRTFLTEGDTDVDGPFGFSGEFKAWFLADDLRVPAEAHVKVWLGNAKIKLIDYQKERRKSYD